MAFLIKSDMQTHIYPEVLDQISRQDDTIIERGISAGVDEVKAYLSKYDRKKLFGYGTTAKTVDSEFLITLVKAVAAWKIILLSNPNINIDLFKQNYDDSIKTLKDIQKGIADPEDWPYIEDDPTTPGNESNGSVSWSSNPKKTQHF